MPQMLVPLNSQYKIILKTPTQGTDNILCVCVCVREREREREMHFKIPTNRGLDPVK